MSLDRKKVTPNPQSAPALRVKNFSISARTFNNKFAVDNVKERSKIYESSGNSSYKPNHGRTTSNVVSQFLQMNNINSSVSNNTCTSKTDPYQPYVSKEILQDRPNRHKSLLQSQTEIYENEILSKNGFASKLAKKVQYDNDEKKVIEYGSPIKIEKNLGFNKSASMNKSKQPFQYSSAKKVKATSYKSLEKFENDETQDINVSMDGSTRYKCKSLRNLDLHNLVNNTFNHFKIKEKVIQPKLTASFRNFTQELNQHSPVIVEAKEVDECTPKVDFQFRSQAITSKAKFMDYFVKPQKNPGPGPGPNRKMMKQCSKSETEIGRKYNDLVLNEYEDGCQDDKSQDNSEASIEYIGKTGLGSSLVNKTQYLSSKKEVMHLKHKNRINFIIKNTQEFDDKIPYGRSEILKTLLAKPLPSNNTPDIDKSPRIPFDIALTNPKASYNPILPFSPKVTRKNLTSDNFYSTGVNKPIMQNHNHNQGQDKEIANTFPQTEVDINKIVVGNNRIYNSENAIKVANRSRIKSQNCSKDLNISSRQILGVNNPIKKKDSVVSLSDLNKSQRNLSKTRKLLKMTNIYAIRKQKGVNNDTGHIKGSQSVRSK